MLAPDADFVSLLAEAAPSMPPVALIYPFLLAKSRLGHTCEPSNSPSSRGEVDSVVIRATLMNLCSQRTKLISLFANADCFEAITLFTVLRKVLAKPVIPH